MRTRIISSIFGLFFLFFVICFYNTIILNLSVALFCSIMIFEIFRATKILKQSFFAFVICEIFCVSCFLLKIDKINNLKEFGLIGFGAVFLFFLFKDYKTIKVENLIFTFSFSVFLTFSMNILLKIRVRFKPYGIYYMLLLFSVAWLCDTGAYFIGMWLGKHKLAPRISPKKTIEGAIGGVVFCFVLIFLESLFYFNFFCDCQSINYLSLVFVTIIGSVCAIIGDLNMSVVKRNYGIKDFGNIMLGHGGILDRFDSSIFVLIVAYPWLLYYPIISN